MALTFHMIGNAHLDPVWLWDWREGLSEGLQTCRTILDLMDENKDLTFIRGESIIYQHIEQHDPATFKRIAQYVKAGRWDVVGGTLIQPDTNLPMTEVFARHFEHGLRYFQSRFNKRVRVAWAADSFGHAEGLPEILAAAGMKGFAFSRPASNVLPIAKPAFWWQGPGGSRVLAYRMHGWYGCERTDVTKRLDETLAEAQKGDLENVGVFFGLGNHGGGPTRRHLQDIRDWAKQHPEVRVQFSGLHKLIDSLYAEVKKKGDDFLPTHRGEMNFVLRGCYSSLAKFKYLYRKTEAQLSRGEKTDAAIRITGYQPVSSSKHGLVARDTMERAWCGLLFNSFHDILPGSSIERAFDDQLAWLGESFHTAQRVEFTAIADLAQQIDTRVKPVKGDQPSGVSILVWNPHPYEFTGPVEIEASVDYRPIWEYLKKPDELPVRVLDARGKETPFQIIPTEHTSMVDFPWRKRIVLPMKLPAMGWNVIEMAWVEGATPPKVEWPVNVCDDDSRDGGGEIDNGIYRVVAKPDHRGVHIYYKGKPIFGGGSLTAITVEDPWGSWGGMAEEKDSLDLSTVRDQWKITQVQLLERGPLRASMWVRLEGGNSRLDLTFSVSQDRPVVDISARVMWDERSARLKLVMPNVGAEVEYDVPGGCVRRDPAGEVPGGRWARARSDADSFGFASNALYNFDQKGDDLRVTICRATRYANDVKTGPDELPWRPAVDIGELRFNAIITPGDENLPKLAEQLEQPPLALLVPAKKGTLGRVGSLMSLAPANFKLLALKPASDGRGMIVRIQETAGKSAEPKLIIQGKRIALSRMKANTIATWRLTRGRNGWKSVESNIAEE